MFKLFHKCSSKLTLQCSSCENVFQPTRFKSKVCGSSNKSEKGGGKGDRDEKNGKDVELSKDDAGERSESCGMPKVGINGFGRIGRMAMRIAVEHEYPLEIVAINDAIMSPEYMAYLLKYDSTHGRFIGDVDVNDSQLVIDGKNICTYRESDPASIPWKELGVEYVIESSGKFLTVEDASGHLSSGAKKVIITAPSVDAPMYVMGVNTDTYDPSKPVVSSACSTTNALAPLSKIVHERFGLEEGLVSTVHAASAFHNVIDSSSLKNWREGRGCIQNIIPTYTGASEAIGRVLPNLEGKLSAISIRVPTANASLVDLTCRLKKDATIEDIKSALCEASDGPLLNILDVTSEEVVSSDFIGSSYSCIFDTKASVALNKKFFKLIAWFDHEYGYTCRVIDLIKFMHMEKSSE